VSVCIFVYPGLVALANHMKYYCFAFGSLLLLSCNHIETGATLSAEELAYIRNVGLLDQGETVHRFYSNFKVRKAGSFYTNRRMAHYWLDGNDSHKHQREYAFYPDITAIAPIFNVPDLDCPYLLVRRKNQTAFRVYFDGSQKEMHLFYQDALAAWKLHRHDTR
jgi:hypothetical protein